MPKNEKKEKSTFSIPVKYFHVPFAKHNSVQWQIISFTTPFRVQELTCGCKQQEVGDDKNPHHTALSASIKQVIEEKLVGFKTTKNQQIETKHAFIDNAHIITFVLPTAASSIKQALTVIKKVICKKTISRAIDMLSKFNKQYVQTNTKQAINDNLANILTQNTEVTVYGRKEYDQKSKQVYLETLTKKLTINELPSEGLKTVRSDNTHQLEEMGVVYKEIKGFVAVDKPLRALIIVALQNANIDFFIRNEKLLFINKRQCKNEHINPIKILLFARIRFILNLQKQKKNPDDKINKKLYSLVSFVYQQGSYNRPVVLDILQDLVKKKDIESELNKFIENVLTK